MAAKFLSEEWAREVEQGLNSSEAFKGATKGQRARIQQVVNTGDDELKYWIEIDDGKVEMGTGPIQDPNVTITSDYATAVALAKGELSAMAAFMGGKVEVSNVMSAMGLQGALGQFAAVIKSIDTEY